MQGFETIGYNIGLAQTLHNYADLKREQDFDLESIRLFNKSLDISLKEGVLEMPMYSAAKLKQGYAQIGNFKRAYEMSMLHDSLRAEFMDLDKQRTITTLETSFKSKEQQQEIALQKVTLGEQEAKLQRNQILTIGLMKF